MPSELTRTRVILDADLFAGVANANRTPGIHLTDVLRDIEETVYGAHPSDFTEEDLSQYALQGYLWEDAMTETLVRKVKRTDGRAIGIDGYVRVPELAVKLDGSCAFAIDPALPKHINSELARGYLLMSPDGRIELPDRLLECKWTTKSANMQPEKVKRIWFHQVKSYLVGLSIWLGRPVLDVEWHVQFACGDRWGVPPIYEAWNRSYAAHEVFGSFKMVTDQVAFRTTGDVAKGGGTDPHGWRRWAA